MPFRDINPTPVNSLAYGDMVSSIGANVLAGEERGMRNALVMNKMSQDMATQNALAGYFATPEAERGAALNDLAALSPKAAADVLTIENAQRARAQEERRAQALEEYTSAQAVLNLKEGSPAQAIALLDKDGSFRQQLHDAGLINQEDGITDDEARLIAQWVIDTVGPVAYPDSVPGQQRVQSTQVLEDGTIAYITTDGRVVRTKERARNPMQVADVGGSRAVVDRLTGEVQMLSTSEEETAAAARRAEEEKLAGTRGQLTAQRWATQIDEGFAAADSLPVLRRGLELLKDVGIETGGLDALKLWASNRLGVTGADEGELSANLGKAVLAQLRSTFGAQFTEREGARLAEIEAGFGKSTAANTRLLEQAYQLVERTAKRGINAARSAGDNDSAQMIEDAMNFRITYDDVARGGLPPIALDENGAPIRQPSAGGWSIVEE